MINIHQTSRSAVDEGRLHCRRSASFSISSVPALACAHRTGCTAIFTTVAYGLPQWQEISTFNYGYAPCDDSVAEVWPNEPHQIQLYAEVAKAVQAAARAPEPARLLEVCCGRGGGLAHLHATLSPRATIGIDRSLTALRHRRNGNAAIARLQGHALQLPFPEASIDLAVNVEALADLPKLPFLAGNLPRSRRRRYLCRN